MTLQLLKTSVWLSLQPVLFWCPLLLCWCLRKKITSDIWRIQKICGFDPSFVHILVQRNSLLFGGVASVFMGIVCVRNGAHVNLLRIVFVMLCMLCFQLTVYTNTRLPVVPPVKKEYATPSLSYARPELLQYIYDDRVVSVRIGKGYGDCGPSPFCEWSPFDIIYCTWPPRGSVSLRKQFIIFIPGKPSPLHQKQALPFLNTCDRISSTWSKHHINPGRSVYSLFHA